MSFEVATWDVIYDEITQNNQLSGIVVFDAERVEIQDTHVDVWTVEDGKDVHYILPWSTVIFIKEVIENVH